MLFLLNIFRFFFLAFFVLLSTSCCFRSSWTHIPRTGSSYRYPPRATSKDDEVREIPVNVYVQREDFLNIGKLTAKASTSVLHVSEDLKTRAVDLVSDFSGLSRDQLDADIALADKRSEQHSTVADIVEVRVTSPASSFAGRMAAISSKFANPTTEVANLKKGIAELKSDNERRNLREQCAALRVVIQDLNSLFSLQKHFSSDITLVDNFRETNRLRVGTSHVLLVDPKARADGKPFSLATYDEKSG